MSVHQVARNMAEAIMTQVDEYVSIYDRTMGDCEKEREKLMQYILTGERQYRLSDPVMNTPQPDINLSQMQFVGCAIEQGRELMIRELIAPQAATAWADKRLRIELHSITTPSGIQRSTPDDVWFHHDYLDHGMYRACAMDWEHNEKTPLVSVIYSPDTAKAIIVTCPSYRQGRPTMVLSVTSRPQ